MEKVVEKIKNILSAPKKGVELILLSLLILSKSIVESHRTPNESLEYSPKTARELYSNPAAIKLGKKLSENVNVSEFIENVDKALVTTSNLSPEEISSALNSMELSKIVTSGLKSIMYSMITPQSQLGICEGYLDYLIGMYSDDRDRFKHIINENKLVIIGLFKTIIMATYVSQGGDIKSRKKNGRTIISQKKNRKLKIQHGGNAFIDYIVNSLNSGIISPIMFSDGAMFDFFRYLNFKLLNVLSTILTFVMMNIDASNKHNKASTDTIIRHGLKQILKIEIFKYHLDVTFGVDKVFYIIDKISGKIREPSDRFNKIQVNASGEQVIVNTSFNEELQKAGLTKLYHTLLLLTLIDGTYIVIEKNPAVDIYSITQNEVTKLKKKPGFESYGIKQFNVLDNPIFQTYSITGSIFPNSNTAYNRYIHNTFGWLLNNTERSVDKNAYFNYRLFGDGTCQNFVHYFVETLARNRLISGTIMNQAQIFYMQSVCRFETLMIDFVAEEIIPIANAFQTSFYLLVIGKRQLGDLLHNMLDYAHKTHIEVKNFFNSPQGINSKRLLFYMSSLLAGFIKLHATISQGGYSSKSNSSRRINRIKYLIK